MTAPLPPLPPMLGADEADARPAGSSIVEVLGREHRVLAQLFSRLTQADDDDPQLGALTSVLVAMLTRHLSAEEQYLYPTVRAALPDGDQIADREVNADQAIQYALRRLENGPPQDRRGLEEVDPALRLHIQRCERDIFPRLADVVSTTDLIRLGNRAQIAFESAPTRPHPGTPTQPPLNKVVDPVVAIVDKVRDVVTGRATQPEDL